MENKGQLILGSFFSDAQAAKAYKRYSPQKIDLVASGKIERTGNNPSGVLMELKDVPSAYYDIPTLNRMIFEKVLWENILSNEDFTTRMRELRCWWGEPFHTDLNEVLFPQVSHKVTDFKIGGDNLILSDFSIVDTPNGNIIYTLMQDGYVGNSTRGFGQLIPSEADPTLKIVSKDSYVHISQDFVANQAVPPAMSKITQSYTQNPTLLKNSMQYWEQYMKRMPAELQNLYSHIYNETKPKTFVMGENKMKGKIIKSSVYRVYVRGEMNDSNIKDLFGEIQHSVKDKGYDPTAREAYMDIDTSAPIHEIQNLSSENLKVESVRGIEAFNNALESSRRLIKSEWRDDWLDEIEKATDYDEFVNRIKAIYPNSIEEEDLDRAKAIFDAGKKVLDKESKFKTAFEMAEIPNEESSMPPVASSRNRAIKSETYKIVDPSWEIDGENNDSVTFEQMQKDANFWKRDNPEKYGSISLEKVAKGIVDENGKLVAILNNRKLIKSEWRDEWLNKISKAANYNEFKSMTTDKSRAIADMDNAKLKAVYESGLRAKMAKDEFKQAFEMMGLGPLTKAPVTNLKGNPKPVLGSKKSIKSGDSVYYVKNGNSVTFDEGSQKFKVKDSNGKIIATARSTKELKDKGFITESRTIKSAIYQFDTKDGVAHYTHYSPKEIAKYYAFDAQTEDGESKVIGRDEVNFETFEAIDSSKKSIKSSRADRIREQLYWEIGQGIGDPEEHKKLIDELEALEQEERDLEYGVSQSRKSIKSADEEPIGEPIDRGMVDEEPTTMDEISDEDRQLFSETIIESLNNSLNEGEDLTVPINEREDVDINLEENMVTLFFKEEDLTFSLTLDNGYVIEDAPEGYTLFPILPEDNELVENNSFDLFNYFDGDVTMASSWILNAAYRKTEENPEMGEGMSEEAPKEEPVQESRRISAKDRIIKSEFTEDYMRQPIGEWSKEKYDRLLKLLKSKYYTRMNDDRSLMSVSMNSTEADAFEKKYGICFEYTDSGSTPMFPIQDFIFDTKRKKYIHDIYRH